MPATNPRILILSTAYLPLIGGSELAIRHITDRLTGYDFDMVTGRYTSDMSIVEQVGRIRVFRAGGRFSRLSLFLPKAFMPLAMAITAWRLSRTRQYALVHAYQASQAAGAAWLLTFLRPSLPVVLTIQEGKALDTQPLLLRLFRRLIFRSADRITAISTYLAVYARRYTRVPIDIIPNGVDVQALASDGSVHASDEKVILSVSRLAHKNGIANLIRALPHISKQLPTTSYKLLLVGGGSLEKELRSLAADLHVAGQVEFIGSVSHDQLPSYLHRADVFVRPSLSEGLGSAFLEAMAAGVPVVASRVGGIADFLQDGQTGLVCDPTDPADIAAKIITVLTDQVVRDHIASQALAMVRERYDWDVVATQMDSVYKEVIHA